MLLGGRISWIIRRARVCLRAKKSRKRLPRCLGMPSFLSKRPDISGRTKTMRSPFLATTRNPGSGSHPNRVSGDIAERWGGRA